MSTTPFLRLPFTVPSSIGSALDASKVTPVISTPYELDAYGHWLLGGSASSLTDIKSGKSLTFGGGATVPIYSPNCVTLSGANGGLKSDVADRLDRTMAGVVKIPASGSTAVAGTWNGAAGAVFWIINTGAGVSPTPTGVNTPAGAGSWVFFAFSTSSDLTRRAKIGGGTVFNGSAAHSLTGFLSLHDTQAHGLNGAMDFAECIIWPRSMTEAEMDAVYARSKARMAARGIAVY